MENNQSLPQSNSEDSPGSHQPLISGEINDISGNKVSFPQKPSEVINEKKFVWIRSIGSLLLYIVIGYFFFQKNWLLIAVLTGVVVIHELGHFIAMKIYRYKDLSMFFIPLMGAYVSGTKEKVSQKQSVIISLAGPVPGILIGLIMFVIAENNSNYMLERISWIFVILNLLNLIPVYPLDGGQLLNKLFIEKHSLLSKLFIIVSSALVTWFAISTRLYPLLIFPFMLITRLRTEFIIEKEQKKLTSEGINLNKTFDELTDEEYWRIRESIVIEEKEGEHARLTDGQYDPEKEQHIIQAVKSLLKPPVKQDLGLTGIFFVVTLWIGCFIAPELLGLPLRLFF